MVSFPTHSARSRDVLTIITEDGQLNSTFHVSPFNFPRSYKYLFPGTFSFSSRWGLHGCSSYFKVQHKYQNLLLVADLITLWPLLWGWIKSDLLFLARTSFFTSLERDTVSKCQWDIKLHSTPLLKATIGVGWWRSPQWILMLSLKDVQALLVHLAIWRETPFLPTYCSWHRALLWVVLAT